MKTKIQNKRDIIFSAAIHLIAKKGLHNTPVSEIAKFSGVSVGAIYSYFKNKNELINELFVKSKHDFYTAALHQYDKTEKYEKRFYAMWKNLFEYLIANPDLLSFLEQCSNSPVITEASKNRSEKDMRQLIDFIEEGIRKKIIKKGETKIISLLVYSDILSIARLQLQKDHKLEEKVLEFCIRYSWNGIIEK